MKYDKHLSFGGNTPASYSRRSCLKLLSGTAIGGAALISAPLVAASSDAASELQMPHLQKSESLSLDKPVPDITINININRHDLVDWMMIENLREVPLVLKQFTPRWVAYNNRLLDLDAMLSRQQRGVNQLEIWPNYAWNHSLRGAVRPMPGHAVTTDYYDARLDASLATAGHRSLQLSCCVDAQGIVQLLPS